MKSGKLMVEIFEQRMKGGIPEYVNQNLDEIFVHSAVEEIVVKCTTIPDLRVEAKFDTDVSDKDGKVLVKNGIQVRILVRNKKFDSTKAISKENKKRFCVGFGGLHYNPNDYVNARLWDGRIVRVSYLPD